MGLKRDNWVRRGRGGLENTSELPLASTPGRARKLIEAVCGPETLMSRGHAALMFEKMIEVRRILVKNFVCD